MEDCNLLNKNYIRIKNMNMVSYGGNQSWCKNKKLQKAGCGVLAMADLTIYFAEQNPGMMTDAIRRINKPNGLYNKNDYLTYVRWFNRHYVVYLMHNGLTGIAIMNTMNRYFIINDISLRARWKLFLSDEAMMKEIKHMIKRDRPVILSVGPNTPNVFGKKGITFYVAKEGRLLNSAKKDVKSHFVVVTGVTSICDKEYLIVSSWGKEYYINYEEYRDYVKNSGGRMTSSLLSIRAEV